MQFTSFNDFINMGGYGFYVWLSFGAAALILTLLTINSAMGHKQVINQIAKRKKREDKLREAKMLRQQQKEFSDKPLNEVTE
ncbi:heme exporter protein CcmD [Colwellia sp. E2M01]|uniref:heme exporter protein CcmD n=1 Tax=Colwellia sp. E2M01 TaxID=2841561 RepID=UPI001C091A33|nr:heme exporter protein CcmD [Colwellia sp. E2M01]MBU2869226.1 heme exporter protein CcmD [Colwellia sp. E2M01]